MEWIFLAILAFALFTFLGYNRIIRLRSNVYKNYDVLDKQLEKRNDLVNDIMPFLQKTFKNDNSKLIDLHDLILKDQNDDLTIAQRIKLNNRISFLVKDLMEEIGEHADLKKTVDFEQFKKSLISTSRQLEEVSAKYNEWVVMYNNSIYMFPSNVFAMSFGFKPLPEFENIK